jgi:hypothetical protein
VRAIKHSICRNKALSRSCGISKDKQKTYGTAVSIDPLDVAEVERAWIDNLKEHVDFLNDNLRCYSLLFRVQRRELVTNGDALN